MADNDCLHLLHLDLAGLPRKNHAQSPQMVLVLVNEFALASARLRGTHSDTLHRITDKGKGIAEGKLTDR
jgi:hypothetical protein